MHDIRPTARGRDAQHRPRRHPRQLSPAARAPRRRRLRGGGQGRRLRPRRRGGRPRAGGRGLPAVLRRPPRRGDRAPPAPAGVGRDLRAERPAAGAEADCAAPRITPGPEQPRPDRCLGRAGARSGTHACRPRCRSTPACRALACREAELATVAEDPRRLAGIELRLVMSHLACAERQDHAMNRAQLRRFAGRPPPPAAGAGEPRQLLGHLPRARLPLRPRPPRCRPLRPRPGRRPGEPDAAGRPPPRPDRPDPRRSRRERRSATAPPGARTGRGASPRSRSAMPTATCAASATAPPPSPATTPVPLVGIVSMDTATFDVTGAPDAVGRRLPRPDRPDATRPTRWPRRPEPSATKSSPPSAAATPAPMPAHPCSSPPSKGSRHENHHPRQRRHRHHQRLVSGRGRPRGHRPRPPARPGAGDELRQRRRGLARLRLALGGARHPAEGDEVAVHAAQPAVHPPDASTRPCCASGLAMLRNCTAARLRAEQEPDGAARRVQPRHAAARSAPTTGIAYDERSARHAAAVPHPEAARRRGQGRQGAGRRSACRTRCSTATAASAPSPRSARCATSSSAACGCRATRPATASSSPARSRDLAAARGVDFRYGVTINGLIADGDRITGVATDAGPVAGDAYVAGARQPLAAAAEAARHRPAGLPGQGLLADRADHRPGRRARVRR